MTSSPESVGDSKRSMVRHYGTGKTYCVPVGVRINTEPAEGSSTETEHEPRLTVLMSRSTTMARLQRPFARRSLGSSSEYSLGNASTTDWASIGRYGDFRYWRSFCRCGSCFIDAFGDSRGASRRWATNPAVENRPTIPTPAGQRPCANSGDAPRRNWSSLLTHRLGSGRHSLDLFGVRAPVGSHRDSQQIHPNWPVARDPVGRSPFGHGESVVGGSSRTSSGQTC